MGVPDITEVPFTLEARVSLSLDLGRGFTALVLPPGVTVLLILPGTLHTHTPNRLNCQDEGGGLRHLSVKHDAAGIAVHNGGKTSVT